MKEFNYVDTDSIKTEGFNYVDTDSAVVEEDSYVRDMKREGTSAYAYFTKKEDE